MAESTPKILTTHTGSLCRAPELSRKPPRYSTATTRRVGLALLDPIYTKLKET